MHFNNDESTEEGLGECLRYPPKLYLVQDKLLSVVPLTPESSTCGEYVASIWRDLDETKVQ